MSGRKDFLSQQAPENYVAGLGRGATGFTTRSDLGPAREGPSEDQIKEALAKRAAQLGNAPPTAYGVGKKKAEDEEVEDQFRDAENEEGLFATGNYDRDDDEADRIYQSVDERMDKRRRARRLVSPSLPCTSLPFLSSTPLKADVHHLRSSVCMWLDSMPT
jgi:pre-mRNA-processing factor 6